MSRTSLEDTKYELIKAHMLDPDSSPLSEDKQEMLDRILSAAKLLDKNPVQKQAVSLHQKKYPTLCRTQAYEDLRIAVRLFNTLHTFDYDFWRTWLINDIVKNIEDCRKLDNNTVKDRSVISAEHANLFKVIGQKPEDLPDPERNEKHQFYILIQNNNQQIKVDINNLQDLPASALKELSRAIYGGNEITDTEAEELIKT